MVRIMVDNSSARNGFTVANIKMFAPNMGQKNGIMSLKKGGVKKNKRYGNKYLIQPNILYFKVYLLKYFIVMS